MKTLFALTPKNAGAIARYAKLAGNTPPEFLNQFLDDCLPVVFEGDAENHLTNLEYILHRSHQVLGVADAIRRGSGRPRLTGTDYPQRAAWRS